MKMKKTLFITISALLALGYMACKQTLGVEFSQPPAIYFGTPAVYAPSTGYTAYSFAKYPSRIVDTIKVPVYLLGDTASVNREISVSVADSSAANGIAGQDFKLLPPYYLPAHATSSVIPVVVYRTSVLDTGSVTFFLKVKANQNFQPGITAQTTWKITVSYLQKPATWDIGSGGTVGWALYPANLGTWTKTKYKLVISALYNPIADTSITEFPYSRFQPPAIYIQYLQLVKNYILTNYPGNYSTPIGIGPTLRDPDANNAVIQVGPANY